MSERVSECVVAIKIVHAYATVRHSTYLHTFARSLARLRITETSSSHTKSSRKINTMPDFDTRQGSKMPHLINHNLE